MRQPRLSTQGKTVKVVVVTPTYNERENVLPLLSAVQEAMAETGYDTHILVVDDNSPDGTGQAVREAQQTSGNVHLLVGEKRGLGAAYVRGIRHALDELSADAIVQMDADFSHLPQDIPRLLAELDRGADFVIGSRWLEGGKIPSDWSLPRRSISRWGNLSARFISGLYNVHDCTNGFRAIRGDLLRQLDMGQAWPKGYTFLVSLLYQAIAHGGKIKEVPVEYVDRTRGESKLRFRELFDTLLNVMSIRVDRTMAFLKIGDSTSSRRGR